MPEPSSMLALTPGAYLKHRRQAAGMAIVDVARAVETEPRIAEHLRGAFLELVEADAQPLNFSTVVALRVAFRFDVEVLFALALGHLVDLPRHTPRLCRYCACSENDPCAVPATGDDETGVQPCHWVGQDLCSRCAPALQAVA